MSSQFRTLPTHFYYKRIQSVVLSFATTRCEINSNYKNLNIETWEIHIFHIFKHSDIDVHQAPDGIIEFAFKRKSFVHDKELYNN